MIVGHGNIASAITDRDSVIFFASGVSNSRCEDYKEFWRERDLLAQYYEGDKMKRSLFYFSSIAVDLGVKTPYLDHKRRMEDYVRSWFPNYVILRIGNLEWDTNPNTFINYINQRKKAGLSCEIADEYRYMVNKETFQMLCSSLPDKGKHVLSVASRIGKVRDLL
jgi:hypothetical protein